jgi:hypothetical protein
MKIQERKSADSAVLVLATAVVVIVGLQMFSAEVGSRVIAPSISADTGCISYNKHHDTSTRAFEDHCTPSTSPSSSKHNALQVPIVSNGHGLMFIVSFQRPTTARICLLSASWAQESDQSRAQREHLRTKITL